MVFTTLHTVFLYVAKFLRWYPANVFPGARLRNLYIENKSELNYLHDKVARQEKIIKSLKARLECEIELNNKNNQYRYDLRALQARGGWVTLDEEQLEAGD